VSVSPVTARGVPLVNEPTDPIGPLDAGGAAQRPDDITAESTEPAADEERRRSFSYRIGSRKVWLPLALVAALLVGFGSMTVVLRLIDWPKAQSDTKPVPTTAAPVVPPSVATPAVTTPRTSAASGPVVENEPPPEPAPAPTPDASASPAPPSSNLNPAGNAPPGLNR
jgi:hypothetical protein